MKQIFLVFCILICSGIKALACCAGQMVSVLPSGTNITRNSVFVILFAENDFRLRDKINKFEFVAIINGKKRKKLKTLAINFSGSMGEVVLQSAVLFKENDSIEIKIIASADYDTSLSSVLNSQLQMRKWRVHNIIDNASPIWKTNSISTEVMDSRNSSAPSVSFKFTCDTQENTSDILAYNYSGSDYFPVLYEITIGAEKLILPGIDNTVTIGWSICGNDYTAVVPSLLSAKIKPMDSSGNYGEEKIVSFEFPKFVENEIILEQVKQ